MRGGPDSQIVKEVGPVKKCPSLVQATFMPDDIPDSDHRFGAFLALVDWFAFGPWPSPCRGQWCRSGPQQLPRQSFGTLLGPSTYDYLKFVARRACVVTYDVSEVARWGWHRILL